MKHDRVHATFKTSIGEVFATIQATPAGPIAKASLVDAHLHGDWTLTLFSGGGITSLSWQLGGSSVPHPLDTDLPASHQEVLQLAARAMLTWETTP